MSRPWIACVLLAACAGAPALPTEPLPDVAVCGPEEQGPPIWNDRPLDARPTPRNPKPPEAIVFGPRVGGSKFVLLGDDALRALKKAGVSKVTVSARICLDEQGAVERVCLVNPPGQAGAERTIVAQLSRWRFEPARLDGNPVEVCSPVVLNYTIRSPG
jgi:hypothetical protein